MCIYIYIDICVYMRMMMMMSSFSARGRCYCASFLFVAFSSDVFTCSNNPTTVGIYTKNSLEFFIFLRLSTSEKFSGCPPAFPSPGAKGIGYWCWVGRGGQDVKRDMGWERWLRGSSVWEKDGRGRDAKAVGERTRLMFIGANSVWMIACVSVCIV